MIILISGVIFTAAMAIYQISMNQFNLLALLAMAAIYLVVFCGVLYLADKIADKPPKDEDRDDQS